MSRILEIVCDDYGSSSVYSVDKITELVRCKDCKFYKQLDDACPYLGDDGYYKELPSEYDFCSRGERNEYR